MTAGIISFYQQVQHISTKHYTRSNVNGTWGQYTIKDTLAHFLNLEKIY